MEQRRIFALGFFDGVHLGHQKLLQKCCEIAKAQGVSTGATTFAEHPLKNLRGEAPLLIAGVADRVTLLQQYGMEYVHILPGGNEMLHTPWEDFLGDLMENDGAAGFVCGSDFRFGAGGLGTAKKLEAFCKKRNLPYAIVPQQIKDGVRISSTYIRELIAEGEMEKANTFLGHPHVLTGEVIRGRGLGRTIGVPTANLALPEGVICPRHGVYACKAVVDGKVYLAVTNVGTRPTVNGEGITVESWLLDFAGDLYGKHMLLLFYKFLRPEQKFDSLEELQTEIRKNGEETRKFFEKYE